MFRTLLNGRHLSANRTPNSYRSISRILLALNPTPKEGLTNVRERSVYKEHQRSQQSTERCLLPTRARCTGASGASSIILRLPGPLTGVLES